MKTKIILILCAIWAALFNNVQAQQRLSVPSAKTEAAEKMELGVHSPNELNGFKFFKEGKLNKLKLGISNRDDVKKIFGEPRQIKKKTDFYDYDSNWEIQFWYFEAEEERGYRPPSVILPEYAGRLSFVMLIPKTVFSLSNANFSDVFKKMTWDVTDRSRDPVDYYDADYFSDSYGLTYEVFLKSNHKNEIRRPGDLIAVKYYLLGIDKLFVKPEGF